MPEELSDRRYHEPIDPGFEHELRERIRKPRKS